jgi:ribosome biogenesis GTPase
VIDLGDLGWDTARELEWAAIQRGDDVPGRLVLEHNHIYRVLTADGEVLAEAAGRLKHRAGGRHELPAVGDWVIVRVARPGHRSQIRGILQRRSVFSRKAAGRETEEQVIAANIDEVFVVFGLDSPLKLRAIERYLVVARRSGARPVVVLNKRDLHPDVAAAVTEVTASVGDVPVHATSTREGYSLDSLAGYLAPGRTIALIGPSGAGKSSLVNQLVGHERLPTGDVREWDARGRHTSVHRELVVRAEGGLIIDTPGMRELQLWGTDDDVAGTFDDIAELARSCRFRDCQHEHEPGCAVKAAVDDGTLEGRRYESYLKLTREQAAVEQKRDERALLDAKRLGKIGSKALKAMQKDRGR